MLIKNVDNNTPIIRLSNKTKIANRMTKLRERERERVKLSCSTSLCKKTLTHAFNFSQIN